MSFRKIGLAGCLAAVAIGGLVIAVPARDIGTGHPLAPALVTIQAGAFEHPLPGEFLHADGRPAPAPRALLEVAAPLEIMRYQVSFGEYGRCVAAGACKAADGRGDEAAPVTGVSHIDAKAYARWLSNATGETWRLPTDLEWAFAAGEKFTPDIEPTEEDPANPAQAWLSSYRREAGLGRKADPVPKVRGWFGENAKGIADMAGNVWEWTSSCYVRTTLAKDGKSTATQVENCGVHVVEGFHRTYMSNFIRDGKSGGCAVGLPPDNLGFRLVRESPGLLERLLALL